MYAVYLCGCTDCFLSAIFDSRDDAVAWAEGKNNKPEGYLINRWRSIADIDTSDNGWPD